MGKKKLLLSPYRKEIVGTDTMIPLPDGRKTHYINFDNAATTPPLKSVMTAINDFAPWYSSIHRGKGYKSKLSSQLYEETRNLVIDFVKADPELNTVIFVKNATEAINKLSFRLCQNVEKCVILSTEMEHHSNDLPWRDKYIVDFILVDKKGRLILDDLESKLIEYKGLVKLVTVTGASNVTGYRNPIYQIAGLVHTYGAKLLVDGAQLIPHHPVEMKPNNSPEHIDFLVFSGHKVYAPFGTGVLIGPVNSFTPGNPEYVGGGTVKVVTRNKVIWDNPPHKEEAGSPNIMGVVALKAALETLKKLDMNQILTYEKNLADYAIRKLVEIDEVKIYNLNDKNRVAIIPFNMTDFDHETLATILASEAGIAVRNGCFCAQPYIHKLLQIPKEVINKHLNNPDQPHPGLVRVSFGMYNEYSEVDVLVDTLKDIATNKEKYLKTN